MTNVRRRTNICLSMSYCNDSLVTAGFYSPFWGITFAIIEAGLSKSVSMLSIFLRKKLPLPALLFSCCLLPTAYAQEIPPQDAELSGFQYPYPVHYITLKVQGQSLRMAYMAAAGFS